MAVDWRAPQVQERIRRGVQRGLLAAGEEVRDEVLRLILHTPKTGHLYRRRGAVHQASAPGEAPASDTGTLVSRITVDTSDLSALVVRVGAHTNYAAYLEFGTRRMAARPFMRPALLGKTQRIVDLVADEVRAVLVA